MQGIVIIALNSLCADCCIAGLSVSRKTFQFLSSQGAADRIVPCGLHIPVSPYSWKQPNS